MLQQAEREISNNISNNTSKIILKERDTNFELLRIVLMLMIVMLHFNYHGGILENLDINSKSYYIFYFIEYACLIAVNVFGMITRILYGKI